MYRLNFAEAKNQSKEKVCLSRIVLGVIRLRILSTEVEKNSI